MWRSRAWRCRRIASLKGVGGLSADVARCHTAVQPTVPPAALRRLPRSFASYTSASVFGSRSPATSFCPIKIGIPISIVRHCSAEVRAMGTKDRDVLPDV